MLFAPPENCDSAEELLKLVQCQELLDDWREKRELIKDDEIDLGLVNKEKEEQCTLDSWRYSSPLDIESDIECEPEHEVLNSQRIIFHQLNESEQKKERELKRLLILILRKCIKKLSEPNHGNKYKTASKSGEEEGFLTAHLTNGMTRSRGYMGVCKSYLLQETGIQTGSNSFPRGPGRRIDMKVYTRDEFPTAILYFTGSAYFNRSMRHYAKKMKNVSLGDRWAGPNTNENEKENEENECIRMRFKDEEDIFRQLDLPYIAPHLRNH